MKFLISKLVFILFFLRSYRSFTKCNVPVLNKFMLTGMSHSIYDKMLLCGHVHDKCCSVADEIKISKLWSHNTKPLLSSYVDGSIYYISRIMNQFWELAKLDPRAMNLKYLVKKKIPFQQEYCTTKMEFEGVTSKTQLKVATDHAYTKTFSYNKTKKIHEKVDTKKYTHDKSFDERHWNLKIDPASHANYKQRDTVMPFENDTSTVHTVVCKKKNQEFWKDFILINQKKAEYCYGIYDKMLAFDNKRFNLFIKNVKSGLMTMIKYKGAFYCSICDAHQQKYIDVTKNELVFDKKYCQSTLRSNESVIKFLHIIFIEYSDMLMQYMNCFETDAKVYNLPFQNFLVRFKRRIPLIKKCYANLEEEGFMESCWFLCRTYDPFGISSFFEGDMELYKRIYLALYSFLRKMEMMKMEESKMESKVVSDNVDGLLIEPLNPSHSISKKYYVSDEIRKDLLGALNTNKQPSRDEVKMAHEIFKLYNDKLGLKEMEKLGERFKLLDAKKRAKVKALVSQAKQLQKAVEKEEEQRKKDGKPPKFEASLPKPKEGEVPKKTASGLEDNFKDLGMVKNKETNYLPIGLSERKLRLKSFKKVKLIQNRTSNEIRRLEEKKKEAESKNETDEDKKKDKKEIKKPEVKHSRIEPGAEIFEKNEDALELGNLHLTWGDDGINPVSHISLIDFDVDVTDIIQSKFKKPEAIKTNIIRMYLSFQPKEVNTFNHEINEVLMGGDEMAEVAHEYLHAKKELRVETDKMKRAKHEENLRKIATRHKLKIKSREDKALLKKLKQRQKDAKLKALSENKVELNNHIDQEHYDSNFNGIQDMFVKLFGT